MHDDFTKLMTVYFPEDLAVAFGYTGNARYVGFYWERAGDELTWFDGQNILCGSECQYFLKISDIHKLMERQIGDSDNEPANYLLVDRKSNVLYVGDKTLVDGFLKMQWRPIQPVQS
jgi:hypothetical protein